MVSDTVLSILVQICIVVLLCIGFTFTYMIERFPNFAHIDLTLIGTIVTFSMVKLLGINPYYSWPVSMIICGLIGVIIHVGMVEPIRRRRDDRIALTIAFMALGLVLQSLVGVYSYWIVTSRHETTRGFILKGVGFSFNGVSGVFIIAPLTSLALIMALYYLFTRTRLGLAIRAVAENSDLSAVFGVNTNHIHRLSWFIVGALSGLSGAIIPLWTTVRGGYGEEMLMTVMAGSLIGGLDNIVGAVVGGVTIALFQEWFVGAMMNYKLDGVPLLVNFSTLIHGYSKLIPLVFIVLVLMLLPGGVTQYIRKKGWALDKPEKQME